MSQVFVHINTIYNNLEVVGSHIRIYYIRCANRVRRASLQIRAYDEDRNQFRDDFSIFFLRILGIFYFTLLYALCSLTVKNSHFIPHAIYNTHAYRYIIYNSWSNDGRRDYNIIITRCSIYNILQYAYVYTVPGHNGQLKSLRQYI